MIKKVVFWAEISLGMLIVLKKGEDMRIYGGMWTLFVFFLVGEGLLALSIWLFKRVQRKYEAFPRLVTVGTTLGLFLGMVNISVSYDGMILLYLLLTLCSTAALFAFTPERIKLLPYFTVVLMGLAFVVLLLKGSAIFEDWHYGDGDAMIMLMTVAVIPTIILLGMRVWKLLKK